MPASRTASTPEPLPWAPDDAGEWEAWVTRPSDRSVIYLRLESPESAENPGPTWLWSLYFDTGEDPASATDACAQGEAETRPQAEAALLAGLEVALIQGQDEAAVQQAAEQALLARRR